ncbi:flavin-containing monooxygenase [Microbacterium sp. DT81.1]|uniref:flavin-containing monooxygenase n=1 Tax=Microbacterium sp. DT81.1 TaxID=3393413 RepID=UPI003CE92C98
MAGDVDVVIVGAGISGIGVARALKISSPGTTFRILEARDAIGGTWDLFRYPGVRSDSDLYTFGYQFRPWTDADSIASGASILDYLRRTVAEEGIEEHISLQRRVVSAEWSSRTGLWTVQVRTGGSDAVETLTAAWLFCAGGYYRYDEGYRAEIPGLDRFQGQRVHPQHWPEDLRYDGKRVVVIGSGATAVTLVPALAKEAVRVTMVQRTPGYILSAPAADKMAARLRRVFGDRAGHRMARAKNIAQQRVLWLFCRRFPKQARRLIRWTVAKQLPPGYPVDVDFDPPYNPWDQRLCIVPDGDLFASMREGRVEVVTDRIATVTETGLTLGSGREIGADIIVTATGLSVLVFGGIALRVDGEEVLLPDRVAYKGIMLDGVPNFAFAIGYTNASWTLKVGLLADYFCRLLTNMAEHGYTTVTPRRPAGMETRPLLDFAAGYVTRAADALPRQGAEDEWRMSMNYYADVRNLRRGRVRSPSLQFGRAG